MKRAVIFGAAPVSDWSFAAAYLREGDIVICADGGIAGAKALGFSPNWYVGDSDSGGHPLGCNCDLLPSEKDVTDLDMAVSRALDLGADILILLGCTGGREDHHLSAIGQLERVFLAGKQAVIVDERNEISVLRTGITEVSYDPAYRYFGIVPLDRVMRDVSIIGAKYEVSHIDLLRHQSLGISNELKGTAPCQIHVRDGLGLLIRSN